MTKSPVIIVIGGGVNGRMVQHIVPSARIYDWMGPPPTDSAPRSYGANYLWAPVPGIECREFTVYTTIDGQIPTPAAVRCYKQRVNKQHEAESQMATLMATQFKPVMPGYEFVQLPKAYIKYNAHIRRIDSHNRRIQLVPDAWMDYDFLVSTIPLPSLLTLADISFKEIINPFPNMPVYVRVTPTGNLSQSSSVYVNYRTQGTIYRETIRKGFRHDEALVPFEREGYEVKKLVPGKIWDTPTAVYYHKLLVQDNVFCFGRYGAWNSDELVHHTVQNVRTWAQSKGLGVRN